MIFDSVEMARLRRKYDKEFDFRVPTIVLLDRRENWAGERDDLEFQLAAAPLDRQKDWLRRLMSEDPAQHMGAWFEIKLYGWLRQVGQVIPGQEIMGNNPDFLLTVAQQSIAIEARAILIGPEEREHGKLLAEVFQLLNRIERPYYIFMNKLHLSGRLDIEALTTRVIAWLDISAELKFRYEDRQGNIIELESQHAPRLMKVATGGPAEGLWVNPQALQPALKEKADQHRALRRANHPYVVAVFLESPIFSAEEVVEAWFGKVGYIIDPEANKVVDEQLDRSGLHFLQGEVKHRSVSGTLVFRSESRDIYGRRELQCWYVQNPFARSPIPLALFPVEARFCVISQDRQGIKMAWQRGANNE